MTLTNRNPFFLDLSNDILVNSNDKTFTHQLQRKGSRWNANVEPWPHSELPPPHRLAQNDLLLVDLDNVSPDLFELEKISFQKPVLLLTSRPDVVPAAIQIPVIAKTIGPRKILQAALRVLEERRAVLTFARGRKSSGGHFTNGMEQRFVS